MRTPSGNEAILRRDGSVRLLHAGSMTITRTPVGTRAVIVDRLDRSRVVSFRSGYGYVQRPFVYGNREYVQRSYVVNGAVYSQYYRSYAFNGVSIHVYAAPYYYAPAFYGWAYYPWGAPIVYNWGWSGAPWFAFYGGSFAPYPVYTGAAPWLADYVISDGLASAYQNRSSGPSPTDPMSPNVKDYIQTEVQRQISLTNYEAGQQAKGIDPDPGSGGIERVLTDGRTHVFVAANPISVVDATGLECSLSDGDTIQFNPPLPSRDATTADVQVLWSKAANCSKGSTVTIAFQDLQEMHNHMRETVDRGLTKLRDLQGQGVVPNAPPGASAPPVASRFVNIAPPPDPNTGAAISQQAQAADQAEREAAAAALPGKR